MCVDRFGGALHKVSKWSGDWQVTMLNVPKQPWMWYRSRGDVCKTRLE